MFRSHFGETVIVVLAVIMGFIMSLASAVINQHGFNFSNIFKIWSMITTVILLVSMFIPYKDWSGKFTALFHLNETGIAYKLVENILPTFILNTCNTVIVSAANIFYNEAIPANLWVKEWIDGSLHDWPIMFVISYFAAFVAEAAGKWVANKNCN